MTTLLRPHPDFLCASQVLETQSRGKDTEALQNRRGTFARVDRKDRPEVCFKRYYPPFVLTCKCLKPQGQHRSLLLASACLRVVRCQVHTHKGKHSCVVVEA
jgi:hypothetical protein